MSRAPARLRLISLLAAALWAAPLSAASRYDPALRFRTLTTEHFVIYFHQGEDRIAARLAAIAEETWRALQPPLGVPAQRRTHVVLVDQSEVSNGWASPLPYNTIALSAAWPPGSDFLGHTDDWLRLVFTHEFAHIVHLDRSAGWARFVRNVFGRAPLAFPNLFLPLWQIEGLATYEESVVTGAGRLHGGDFRSVERETARAHALEPIDRVNGGLTTWPGAVAPYAYGLGFHEYLAATYGADRLTALADRTSQSLPFLGAFAFKRVYGKALGALWSEYQNGLLASVPPAPPTPEPARLTRHGFTVLGPRFLPPACASCPLEILYSLRAPHGFPALNAVAADRAAPRQVTTRYFGSTTGVGRDVIVFDQQELHRSVGLYSDLYVLDRKTGGVQQLTAGARLLDPDLSPDDTTIVAVREGLGRRELVTVRLKPDTTDKADIVSASRRTAEILISEPDTQFNTPRWSPDGRSIAVERHLLGGAPEIVVVDSASGAVRVIASAPETRFVTPAWRPDGRAIVAAAAHDGEPFNLYEFEAAPWSGGARQLTNTTGGATWPDVSPDGKTIVFVGYTTDGFDLFTIPYPTAASSPPPTVGPSFSSGDGADDVRAKAPPAEARAHIGSDQAPARRYNPLPTLTPTSWVPVLEIGNDQLRIGGSINGYDVLGYHAYRASATWLLDVPAAASQSTGARPDWEVTYAYDRWQPTLFLSASRDTSFIRADDLLDSVIGVRSHQLEAGILVPLRRVRVSHHALASVVRTTDQYAFPTGSLSLNRTAARAGWATSSARFYGFSVSPEHGVTAGATAELVPEPLGTTATTSALSGDLRAYLPGARQHHVVALRAGGGVSNGDPRVRRTFVLGGAAPNAGVLDFDGDAFSLMRGFEANAFAGRRIALVNAEYRWPLARPERGFATWPLFLHTVHAALFADAGHAWSRRFRMRDIKTSAGAELSADVVAGYSVRLTVTAGAAWGRDGARRVDDGATMYVRVGRAF